MSKESYAKELAGYGWVRRRWKRGRLKVFVANERTGSVECHVLVVGEEHSPAVTQQIDLLLGRGKSLAREPIYSAGNPSDHDHCPF